MIAGRRIAGTKVKQRAEEPTVIALVKRLLPIAAFVVMIPACGEPSHEEKLRQEAESVSRDFVLKFLKWPDDAEFVYDSSDKTEGGGGAYHITSKVKARNGFGATLTHRWETYVVLESGAWKLVSCTIDGEVLFDSKDRTNAYNAKIREHNAEVEARKKELEEKARRTTPEQTARQGQAEREEAARKQAAVEAKRKAQGESKRLLEERAKKAAEKAPLILKQAKHSVEEGKTAKAKDRHEEASTLFQQAVERCEEILKTAAQTPAAGDAKGLLEEARKLLAAGEVEVEGARKLVLAKKLIEESKIEKLRGNTRQANAVIERVKLRLGEIIKTYPKTKAAAEAEELLDKLD
jgi:hypothetical protein